MFETIELWENKTAAGKNCCHEREDKIMIKEMLSKAKAEEIFSRECCYMNGCDVIPEYRCYELFGESAADYIERSSFRQWVGGQDWNVKGDFSEERPSITYILKSGFMKLVSENNYLIMTKAYKESEGGKIADKYHKISENRLAEKEAEAEAKRAERKAKRATAKATREAKAEAAAG